MGVRADIRDEVRKETVTKIHGQPTNQDLMILEKELIAILANIPTTLGGGNHGHAGILMDPARYLMTAGVQFVNPANPGNYPANVPGKAAAGVWARAEAEHKEEVKEYETFQGVVQAAKDIYYIGAPAQDLPKFSPDGDRKVSLKKIDPFMTNGCHIHSCTPRCH